MLLLVVVVAVVGYFAFHNGNVGNKGQIVKNGSLGGATTVGTNTTATSSTGTTGTNTTGGTTCTVCVKTDPATSITQTAATLEGEFTSIGSGTPPVPFSMIFQYGLTPSYGTTAGPITGSTTVGNHIPKGITGLKCGTVYHYRAVGTIGGITANGLDVPFTTVACVPPPGSPTVTTTPATSITQTSAIVHGNISVIGSPSINVRNFTSTAFTLTAVTTPLTSLPSGGFIMSRNVTGLKCGNSYPYEATVTNSAGLSAVGGIKYFTTLPCSTTFNQTIRVSTDSSTQTSPATAILYGRLWDSGLGGAPVTNTGFEYCLGTGGSCAVPPTLSVSTSGLSLMIVPPATPAPIVNSISGLLCKSPYTYRAWASGMAGINYGVWLDFVTPDCSARGAVVQFGDRAEAIDLTASPTGVRYTGRLVSFATGTTSAIVGIQVGVGASGPYTLLQSHATSTLGDYTEDFPTLSCGVGAVNHYRAVSLDSLGSILSTSTDYSIGC